MLDDGESSGTVALKLQAGNCPDADESFQRAVALEQSGDLTGAAEAYRDCLLESGPEPAACFNLANVLDELGETAAAAERYRQVVELDPHYAAAWNNLGRTLSELRKTVDAIAAWQRAVEIDPGSADALFNLADALHEQGRLNERGHTGKPMCASMARAIGAPTPASALIGLETRTPGCRRRRWAASGRE